MSAPAITVLVTVGPDPSHTRWLAEAIESTMRQTYLPSEVLIVDDMAGLSVDQDEILRVYRNPWRLGFAASFNIGMALARAPLVVSLNSDDRLAPYALADCARAWEADPDPRGFYYMDVQYSDGNVQHSPCNAAMIPLSLWQHTGGFPPLAGAGRPDWMFVEAMLRYGPDFGRPIHVQSDAPPYCVRLHPDQETVKSLRYHEPLLRLRELWVQEWTPPTWTARVGEAEA